MEQFVITIFHAFLVLVKKKISYGRKFISAETTIPNGYAMLIITLGGNATVIHTLPFAYIINSHC